MKASEYLTEVFKRSPWSIHQISIMSGVSEKKLKSLKRISAREFNDIIGVLGLNGSDYFEGRFEMNDFSIKPINENLEDEDLKDMGEIMKLLANYRYMKRIDRVNKEIREAFKSLNEETGK